MPKNNPHILYIITKLELGGAQKVCLSLLHNLAQQGIRVTLISGKEGPLVKDVENLDNVILLPSLKRELSLSGIINELRCFFTLVRTIKTIKQQESNLIVHTHSTKAGILGRWAAWLAGVKKRVHTVHGYAFHAHQNKLKWLLIYMAELITSFVTTHFVCVSSHDIKTGTKLFPRFSKKHSLIRAAVDWKQFYLPAQKTTLEPEEKPFIFGTVACFKPQKNMFDLLNAFAFVHKKNSSTHLEIVGDGILRGEIEQWIKEHTLEKAITLYGWQDKVAPIMLNWNAFVLSSLWEGLPCAIIEARLLQLPVLSYNTGGIADVVHDGKNGFLYSQGDWQSLADGMLSLTHNKQIYSALKHHQDNLLDFNDKQMAKHHIDLYKSLRH